MAGRSSQTISPSTRRLAQLGPEDNLTKMELVAVDADVNLADGHPRQSLTSAQLAIVQDLPAMFSEATTIPFEVCEQAAQEAFFRSVGQMAAPIGTGRLLTTYSSSVAIDAVARCIGERGGRVGLIHPTFDNIPDLLKARGLELVPLEEEQLAAGLPGAQLDELSAVFVTSPNNPTGWVIEEAQMRRLAEDCADRACVLALDACFRAFDPRAQYDTYALLDATGVEYVVIEDTGKLWPMLELKVGFVAAGETCSLEVADALSDVLLSVSPVILRLVERLADDAASARGYEQLRDVVAVNRGVIENGLAGLPGVELEDRRSRASVARIRLPEGLSAEAVRRDLRDEGVHALACGPFHWAERSAGDRFLRIALARDEQLVRRGTLVLRKHLEGRLAA